MTGKTSWNPLSTLSKQGRECCCMGSRLPLSCLGFMTGATRLEPNVRRLDLFPELGANRCHLGKGQVGSKPVIVRIEPSSDYGVVGNMIIQTDVLQFCFRDLAFPVQIQTEPNDCIRIGSE